MDKSILISIQPKWCELIASGKKTVEVRKTRPKNDTPFKVYIYCTQASPYNPVLPMRYEKESGNMYIGGKRYAEFLTGKVIGEFVCDEIYTINKDSFGWFYGTNHDAIGIGYAEDIEELWHCIPESELIQYLAGRVGYAWHISNLVIYDKPKELDCFRKPTDCHRGKLREECTGCWDCELKGPPQSWCYVENHSSSF